MIHRDPQSANAQRRGAFFYRSAREAWKRVLINLRSKKVLLPGYIGITDREGSGIFDPILSTNTAFGFYAFDDRLQINRESFEYAVQSGQYDAVLMVHYFGFPDENFIELAKYAKENGLIVIEDCAHYFNWNSESISSTVDFSFFSIHKYLHVPGGGGLLVRNDQFIDQQWDTGFRDKDLFFELLTIDTQKILETRRSNFKRMSELINAINGVIRLRSLRHFDIPHSFPVLIENGHREKLYFWLKDKGIDVTALYYRMIDPIRENLNLKTSIDISEAILNFPIHQDIGSVDIESMSSNIAKGLNEIQ